MKLCNLVFTLTFERLFVLENRGRRTKLATTPKLIRTKAIMNPIIIEVILFVFLVQQQGPVSFFGGEPCFSSRGEEERGCCSWSRTVVSPTIIFISFWWTCMIRNQLMFYYDLRGKAKTVCNPTSFLNMAVMWF